MARNGQLTLNSELVSANVNRISVLIGDIDTRNTAFIALLEEKFQQTNRKFSLFNTLQKRIEKEAVNIKHTIEATESIKDACRRYAEMAEDASDDSCFRRGE